MTCGNKLDCIFDFIHDILSKVFISSPSYDPYERKKVFQEAGCFDEGLTHAFNDVDLCLRIRNCGYLVVFTPLAELYHHESLTRGKDNTPEKQERFQGEIKRFRQKWESLLEEGNTYYSPNLTLEKVDFSIPLLESMRNHSTVSFIIPNWNHRELLSECIESIYETAGALSCEVIVIDNASTDGSAEYIKRKFTEVRWLQNDVNLGYAKAVNQGVGLSSSRFIFLLNNDIKLIGKATERLVGLLANKADAGAAAPLLYYPDGRIQVSCRRFPAPMALLLEYIGINSLGPHRKWKLTIEEHLKADIVPQPMASALMLKRECWDAVGPMDEGFPIFYNDVDWCYRLYKDTDYKIYLCREAKAIHHEGASVKRMGYRKKVEFYKSLLHFYLKHFPALIRHSFRHGNRIP